MIPEHSPFYPLLCELENLTEEIEQVAWEKPLNIQRLKEQDELRYLFIDRIRETFESYYPIAEAQEFFHKHDFMAALKPFIVRIETLPIFGTLPQWRSKQKVRALPVRGCDCGYSIVNALIYGVNQLLYHAIKNSHAGESCQCLMAYISDSESEINPLTDKKTLIPEKQFISWWLTEDIYRCDHCGLYWTFFTEESDIYRCGWRVSEEIIRHAD